MASTAIPEVKAAILEVLGEAKSLEGVTVTGDYKIAERANEHVWLWKAETRQREYRGLGHAVAKPPTIDEEILVTLRIVAIGQASAAEAESRVFELVEGVETALRESIKLGGVAIQSIVDKLSDEPLNFDTKIGHGVLMVVKAKTRI